MRERMRAGGRARRALRHGPLGLGGTLEGWCGARESLSSPAQVTRVASRLVDGRSGDASGAGDASGVRRRKWWRQRLVATQRGAPAPMARCTRTQGRRAPRARPGCAPAPPLQPFSYSLSSTRQLHHILSDRNYNGLPSFEGAEIQRRCPTTMCALSSTSSTTSSTPRCVLRAPRSEHCGA